MVLHAFTLVHVFISLVAIVAGLVAVWGMIAGRRLDGWTAVFLATTVATSVTGFFFPFHGFTPAQGVGVVSLLLLPAALYARYTRRLAGRWRATYVATAVAALYLNFFVLVVQSFQKVPPLKALAPTQSEPPFVATQALALVLFIALGVAAWLRFRETHSSPTSPALGVA